MVAEPNAKVRGRCCGGYWRKKRDGLMLALPHAVAPLMSPWQEKWEAGALLVPSPTFGEEKGRWDESLVATERFHHLYIMPATSEMPPCSADDSRSRKPKVSQVTLAAPCPWNGLFSHLEKKKNEKKRKTC